MPRPPSLTLSYRRHKTSGQAVVTVRLRSGERRDLYLGAHNSSPSRAEFQRITALVAASGGVYPDGEPDITVNELVLAHLKWAALSYRDAGGKTSRSVGNLKYAFRKLKALFGPTPAVEFGPKALKSLMAAWVADGIVRKMVNNRAGCVKRLFKWAVSEELIGADAYQRLQSVEGLRLGRSEAIDNPPVRPAAAADVEAVLPLLCDMVRALLLLQINTGARAGELVKLRVCDIDRTDPAAWAYTPATHKGTWRGKTRTIYFGPKCQEVLAALVARAGPDANAYIFAPARAEDDRNAARGASRKTPKWASHMARNAAKRPAQRGRPPGEYYSTASYRRAIARACTAAGVPTFAPHRLRHLAATRVRAELGVDVARALLGHSLASVTEVYSREVDKTLALKAVARFG